MNENYDDALLGGHVTKTNRRQKDITSCMVTQYTIHHVRSKKIYNWFNRGIEIAAISVFGRYVVNTRIDTSIKGRC
jgi:hypothetical protein